LIIRRKIHAAKNNVLNQENPGELGSFFSSNGSRMRHFDGETGEFLSYYYGG